MTINPFLKKKYENVFRTFFDTNKNGVIDWADFELLFEKVRDLRGEDSNEYKIITDSMLAVWKGLLHEIKDIDMTQPVDKTEEITMEEWDEMWKNFNPKRMPIWQWEYLKYMFFLLDETGDKYIDKREYGDVMVLFGISKPDAEAAFDRFAIDPHTGKPIDKVDYGLFVKLWNEYFTGVSKTKPGAFLFGPIG